MIKIDLRTKTKNYQAWCNPLSNKTIEILRERAISFDFQWNPKLIELANLFVNGKVMHMFHDDRQIEIVNRALQQRKRHNEKKIGS